MELTRNSERVITLGVVLLTVGMAVAVAGVVTTALFFPGVFGIAGGLIVIAAGTILRAARRDTDEGAL
jgi:hypothetical protein